MKPEDFQVKGVTPKSKVETETQPTEKTIIDRIKNSVKYMFKNIAWSMGILAVETFVIMYLWNYVVDGAPLTYFKTMALVAMVRLIFRGTVLDGKEKNV